MDLPVYLDNSATTACDPEVVNAMLPFFSEKYGNASSHFHRYGWEADEAVEQARQKVASLIGAKPAEILFTSGATEACNLGIRGIMKRPGGRTGHVITFATEHRAVLETVHSLEAEGFRVTILPVDTRGLPVQGELERAFTPETVLVAAMMANNETGLIFPVAEMAEIAHDHSAFFFCDATQAAGKIPVKVKNAGIDMLAFTAHKMHGPKGAGALFATKECLARLQPLITGGSQERGFRGGTLNVPAIVGFGKACEIAAPEMTVHSDRLLLQRNALEKTLLDLPGVFLNGHREQRLPHITSLSVEGIDAERLLYYLSSRVALSTGAACSSATREPSHVLMAMDVGPHLTHNSIRLSQGRMTTGEQAEFAAEEIRKAILKLRMVANPSNRRQPSSFSGLPG
jgi:cysteine desulfurase